MFLNLERQRAIWKPKSRKEGIQTLVLVLKIIVQIGKYISLFSTRIKNFFWHWRLWIWRGNEQQKPKIPIKGIQTLVLVLKIICTEEIFLFLGYISLISSRNRNLFWSENLKLRRRASAGVVRKPKNDKKRYSFLTNIPLFEYFLNSATIF